MLERDRLEKKQNTNGKLAQKRSPKNGSADFGWGEGVGATIIQYLQRQVHLAIWHYSKRHLRYMVWF